VLPFGRASNQFAFVRPLDPRRSRQMSCLNNLMFAVLRQVQIKGLPAEEESKASFEMRHRSRSFKGKLYPYYLESIVEVFQAQQDEPIIGTNASVVKQPAGSDPSNISKLHRKLDDSLMEASTAANEEFDLCCWYLIDAETRCLNLTVLLGKKQLVNMRTPLDISTPAASYASAVQTTCIAKLHSLEAPEPDSMPFEDFNISSSMPVFAVDLETPVNFSRLVTFRAAG
jgi:hypothetical protein